MSRCVAATSALTVNRPRVGGQSMTTYGNRSSSGRELVLDPKVRVELRDQLPFQLGQSDPGRRDPQILLCSTDWITSDSAQAPSVMTS